MTAQETGIQSHASSKPTRTCCISLQAVGPWHLYAGNECFHAVAAHSSPQACAEMIMSEATSGRKFSLIQPEHASMSTRRLSSCMCPCPQATSTCSMWMRRWRRCGPTAQLPRRRWATSRARCAEPWRWAAACWSRCPCWPRCVVRGGWLSKWHAALLRHTCDAVRHPSCSKAPDAAGSGWRWVLTLGPAAGGKGVGHCYRGQLEDSTCL